MIGVDVDHPQALDDTQPTYQIEDQFYTADRSCHFSCWVDRENSTAVLVFVGKICCSGKIVVMCHLSQVRFPGLVWTVKEFLESRRGPDCVRGPYSFLDTKPIFFCVPPSLESFTGEPFPFSLLRLTFESGSRLRRIDTAIVSDNSRGDVCFSASLEYIDTKAVFASAWHIASTCPVVAIYHFAPGILTWL